MRHVAARAKCWRALLVSPRASLPFARAIPQRSLATLPSSSDAASSSRSSAASTCFPTPVTSKCSPGYGERACERAEARLRLPHTKVITRAHARMNSVLAQLKDGSELLCLVVRRFVPGDRSGLKRDAYERQRGDAFRVEIE